MMDLGLQMLELISKEFKRTPYEIAQELKDGNIKMKKPRESKRAKQI